jgi:hypothetical protein
MTGLVRGVRAQVGVPGDGAAEMDGGTAKTNPRSGTTIGGRPGLGKLRRGPTVQGAVRPFVAVVRTPIVQSGLGWASGSGHSPGNSGSGLR